MIELKEISEISIKFVAVFGQVMVSGSWQRLLLCRSSAASEEVNSSAQRLSRLAGHGAYHQSGTTVQLAVEIVAYNTSGQMRGLPAEVGRRAMFLSFKKIITCSFFN